MGDLQGPPQGTTSSKKFTPPLPIVEGKFERGKNFSKEEYERSPLRPRVAGSPPIFRNYHISEKYFCGHAVPAH